MIHLNKNRCPELHIFSLKKVAVAIENSVLKTFIKEHFIRSGYNVF